MYGKAFAPEYQGALTTLSVNSSLTEVLAAGTRQLREAERAGEHGEAARSGLAVAEAHRRLGQIGEADRAWKASYRAARAAGDTGAMAWALWSGGTLARQRGSFALARRLLGLAAEMGKRGGDVVVRGYSLAGLAETGRIQGDYEAVARLHEQLLAEARRRGEARHTVWALEGIAQIHRQRGEYDTAYALFEEAAQIAGGADDRRGHAWALRGLAEYDEPLIPRSILEHYGTFDAATRQDALQTLASRPAWAAELVTAVEANRIPRADLTAYTIRQIRSLGDDRSAHRARRGRLFLCCVAGAGWAGTCCRRHRFSRARPGPRLQYPARLYNPVYG